MKKFTKIEVSFINDFVPFLRRFKVDRLGNRDVAAVFIQESRKNLHNLGEPGTALQVYERMRDTMDPEGWVSGSFIWDRSTDGADFWEDVDTKWREFLTKEKTGVSEFIGEITLDDIKSLIPESIQGKYYTVKDLSYNRPVAEVFENPTWNRYPESDLTKTGGKYLILSDYPEHKNMSWLLPGPRPMIKVWVPELNKAWWVFFSSTYVSTE